MCSLAEAGASGMSLARLCKQLGLGASVVMRQLSALGDQAIGGVPGPGFASLLIQGNQWRATLTDAGQLALTAWAAQASMLSAGVAAESPDAAER